MPTLPWKTMREIDEHKTYTVMLTYLPLLRYRDSARFMKYATAVIAQLEHTEGVVGFSLKAHPIRKKYWTISVWEDATAISTYIQTKPHSDIMQKMRGSMGKTAFSSWEITATELPIVWSDAFAHLTRS